MMGGGNFWEAITEFEKLANSFQSTTQRITEEQESMMSLLRTIRLPTLLKRRKRTYKPSHLLKRAKLLK